MTDVIRIFQAAEQHLCDSLASLTSYRNYYDNEIHQLEEKKSRFYQKILARPQLILDSRSNRVSDAMFQLLLLWLFTESWWSVYRIYFGVDLRALIGSVHHFPLVHEKSNR